MRYTCVEKTDEKVEAKKSKQVFTKYWCLTFITFIIYHFDCKLINQEENTLLNVVSDDEKLLLTKDESWKSFHI